MVTYRIISSLLLTALVEPLSGIFVKKSRPFEKMRGLVCVLVCLAALAAQTQGQIGQPVTPPGGQPGGQPGQPGGQPVTPPGGQTGGQTGLPTGQPVTPTGGQPVTPTGGQPVTPTGGQTGQPSMPGQPGHPGGHPGHPHGHPGHPGQPGGQPGQPLQPHGHPPPNHPITAGPNLNGPGKCRPKWTEYKGHCYLYSSGAVEHRAIPVSHLGVNAQEGKTQDAANLYCAEQHLGATLVTLNDVEENDFLYSWAVDMMVEPVPVWIGLHAHPTPTGYQWQWFDEKEPVIFTNWDRPPARVVMAGLGAVLFDADLAVVPPNAIEISGKWLPVEGLGPQAEPLGLICEYSLHAGPIETPTTHATHTNAVGATNKLPVQPATTLRPVMLNNNPGNLRDILRGGPFGGSQLHEVPRGPASYRKNPYFAVQP